MTGRAGLSIRLRGAARVVAATFAAHRSAVDPALLTPPADEVPSDPPAGADEAAGSWVCTYEGYGGAHAQAVFETAEQAMHFAERHAWATGVATLEWSRVEDCWVLGTELGDYLVCSSNGQPPPAERA